MRKTRKVNRRSFLTTVAGGAAAGSLLVVSDVAGAQSGCSDRDPSDPSGRGRNCTGCTDSDPSDSSGRGRNCGRAPTVSRTGCSDRDPSDAGGSGRNCRSTGCSDRDPSDPSGGGRNCGAIASNIRGACSQCSCTSYVQPNEGWACARSGCGHHYNRHAETERCTNSSQC